ncbi:hypothetical protein AGMMS49991_02790 [Spirochaetia bacterium]|nr:hypothetical protein AGMMS49991_02790 [Spirochaetia bacterium]
MYKKSMCLQSFVILCFIFLTTACDGTNTGTTPIEIKTGKVTFFNESSYKVVVHRDSFSGLVLSKLNAGQSERVDVRTGDNYGVGTTFSIEYLYRINDAFDAESGEVLASGLDFNVQLNCVVEENKSYSIQIPQPRNLEFRNAFIKILNVSGRPFELRYVGTAIRQTGNGNLPVAPGKTGVYKLDGIPAAGELYQHYSVVENFENIPIPDFTAMNGFIYSFTYNGSAVTQTGSQTITFR